MDKKFYHWHTQVPLQSFLDRISNFRFFFLYIECAIVYEAHIGFFFLLQKYAIAVSYF